MNCTTWKLDYATSEEIKKHKTNFATSKWMTKVISEVTRKLGFFFDLEICEYMHNKYSYILNMDSYIFGTHFTLSLFTSFPVQTHFFLYVLLKDTRAIQKVSFNRVLKETKIYLQNTLLLFEVHSLNYFSI